MNAETSRSQSSLRGPLPTGDSLHQGTLTLFSRVGIIFRLTREIFRNVHPVSRIGVRDDQYSRTHIDVHRGKPVPRH